MAWVGGGKRMVADVTGPPCMECCRWKRLGDSFACSDALLICLLVIACDDYFLVTALPLLDENRGQNISPKNLQVITH